MTKPYHAELKPVLWPEDAAPGDAEHCTRCELCRHGSRMVWGEGNTLAPVVVILDNPGLREDRDGRTFVCGTRQTLQFAAFETGFKPEDLYVTYLLKCTPKRKYNKTTCRSICIGYLERQLKQNQYKAAFCLGDTAVQAFFCDAEKNVKGMREKWHYARGLPVYVSYHPLAVRRRPNLISLFLADCRALYEFIHTE